jgi:nucleotide-binding universal stress UspA family protein
MIPAFKTILMPTDFSEPSQRALEYATELGRRLGASLHLLHVIYFPIETAASPEGYWLDLGGIRQQMREDAERRIQALASSLQGIEATTQVVEGTTPARAIVSVAKERPVQMIVMGTHGHGGVTHLLLGSVAERVVRTAACPVLTVSAASAEADALKPAAAAN